MSEDEQVTLIQHGEELDVEWKMKSELLSRTYLNSSDFTFEGKYWQLAIWPNGNKYDDTAGFIKVCLERLSSNASNKVDFTFSLKSVNGQKVLKRRKSANFPGRAIHSFEKFMAKSDLIRRQSEFFVSGYFTLVCTLKKCIGSESSVVEAHCSYCEKTFAEEEISSHEKKCRVKCPECSDIILLENWDAHECLTIRAEGKDGVSGSSKILLDFKELFLSQKYSDVIFKVKEQELPAHRNILAARSPVLESAFRSDMKERATGIIDIEDCDPSTFSDFLCFLYCGDSEIISEKNVFSLFVTADKYNVEDLRAKCIDFMKENFSIDTFCDAFILALKYSEKEILERGTDFFAKNLQKIIVTDKWESFLTENPKESNKLFIDALVINKNSDG